LGVWGWGLGLKGGVGVGVGEGLGLGLGGVGVGGLEGWVGEEDCVRCGPRCITKQLRQTGGERRGSCVEAAWSLSLTLAPPHHTLHLPHQAPHHGGPPAQLLRVAR